MPDVVQKEIDTPVDLDYRDGRRDSFGEEGAEEACSAAKEAEQSHLLPECTWLYLVSTIYLFD